MASGRVACYDGIVWGQASLRFDRGPAFYCVCYCSTTGYVSIVRSLVLHIS